MNKGLGQGLDAADGFLETCLGLGGQAFAEIQIHGGNGQPPGGRGVAEDVPREGEDGDGVGGMRQQLRGVTGRELAQLHFARRVHGGIHKDDGVGLGDRGGMFGGKLLANQGAHPGQAQRANRLRHERANAVVPPQRVAISDDEQM